MKVLKEASRLHRPQPSCLLTKADGSWTDSEKETLNLRLDTHFPASEPAETTILADKYHLQKDAIIVEKCKHL